LALRTGEWGDYLRATFPSLDYVPIAFITAKNGRNVNGVLKLAESLHEQATTRASTGDLNRVLRGAVEQTAPPMRQNRRPKIYYATQVGISPPEIVLFTNGPELFDNTYRRYLIKTFRDHLPFADVPIKLSLRLRHREGQPAIEEPPQDTVEPEVPRRRRQRKTSDARTPAPGKSARRPKEAEPKLWKDV
jgi:GTP-binding protein